MAKIYPFSAVRPKKGLESRIAALPYDVYNRKEAKEVVSKEPMSFLKIDRAETQFDDLTDIYDRKVYEKAHDMLWEMIDNGDFVQEEKDCYYIYELIMNGRSQSGIVAKASVDDYLNDVIKKHENTREEKELDRINHVDTCNAQTGPIFLAYRSKEKINAIVEKTKKGESVYSFTSEDGITHNVWIIEAEEDINEIKNQFGKIEHIYIADGHHRCASAVKVSLKRREQNPGYTGEEEYNYFLSVLFPDKELLIMDYNRVVKDLNGLSHKAFLAEIMQNFDVEEMNVVQLSQLDEEQWERELRPECKGKITMHMDGKWYKLTAKENILSPDPVDGLDVSLLQNHILNPILGIEDPKTDNRIDFVGGIRGYRELEKRVKEDCVAAFAMYPTSIQELFAVADAGRLMPPKSTWFEPKLRSGIFIHTIG